MAFSTLLLVHGVAALVGTVTLLAVTRMLLEPLIPATVNALAPPHARATYMATASVVSDLEDTVGPAIATALYAVAARLPYILGIPMALIAAMVLASKVRRHEGRLEATIAPSDPI